MPLVLIPRIFPIIALNKRFDIIRNKPNSMKTNFFKTFITAGLTIASLSVFAQFTQDPLPYASDALEPSIDKMTMEIHYSRHHKAYVDNLNKAVANTDMAKKSLYDLLKDAGKMPPAVRNNAGGHWNHTFFWTMMGPKAGGPPTGELSKVIIATFGSYEKFKEEFKKAAAARFGSGWVWLVVKDKKLVISSTPNQDNPLMDVAEVKGTPILGLDVWEHAYYLKYQNKRPDYVDGFWNVVNWVAIGKRYEEAMK